LVNIEHHMRIVRGDHRLTGDSAEGIAHRPAGVNQRNS
jgi:hypothetical protein